jgi:hypothetical protein
MVVGDLCRTMRSQHDLCVTLSVLDRLIDTEPTSQSKPHFYSCACLALVEVAQVHWSYVRQHGIAEQTYYRWKAKYVGDGTFGQSK